MQIIKEVGPNIDPAVAKLPPLMLDWLAPDYITKDELSQRGYDVPCYPYGVGKTKRGKETRIMGLADGFAFPAVVGATGASPHEVTLLDDTLDACFLKDVPDKIISYRAYDSDKLDAHLTREYGVELIASYKVNRRQAATQDGRALRRYKNL